jgi:hypothetical protein
MSRTVDLHHHVMPDFYWEASSRRPCRRLALSYLFASEYDV